MVTINRVSIDGIELGIDKKNINPDLDLKKYFLEFDQSNKLITVSVRFIHEFSVNGEIVNFIDINDFLIKNKALVDGDFFIIPNYSMSLYIDFEEQIFLEVLIYSSSIRMSYENKELQLFKGNVDDTILEDDILIFTPFKSLGIYNFGESEECFLDQTKLPYHNESGVNGKKYYDYKDIIFRFDQNKMSQICLHNPNIEIIFNNTNINTTSGINLLLEQYPMIKSRSHTIFLAIGIAINNKIEIKGGIEFYFFDNELTKYWKNIHRPITSW